MAHLVALAAWGGRSRLPAPGSWLRCALRLRRWSAQGPWEAAVRPSGPAGTETADPAAFCTPRPLLVLYPEVGMSDFVQDVSEHDALSSHLLEMFGESGERTPEWARMVRPVVPAAAEPATTYGARGRPRRPSGLQSSAAAARPPAVPPWSLSLIEGAAKDAGLGTFNHPGGTVSVSTCRRACSST